MDRINKIFQDSQDGLFVTKPFLHVNPDDPVNPVRFLPGKTMDRINKIFQDSQDGLLVTKLVLHVNPGDSCKSCPFSSLKSQKC